MGKVGVINVPVFEIEVLSLPRYSPSLLFCVFPLARHQSKIRVKSYDSTLTLFWNFALVFEWV